MIGEMWQHNEMNWLTLRVVECSAENVRLVVDVSDAAVDQFNGIRMDFTPDVLRSGYKRMLPSIDDYQWEV